MGPHILFSHAIIMVHDAYGDVVHKAAQAGFESSMARVVEDDENWDLGEILFVKYVDVGSSLFVNFV